MTNRPKDDVGSTLTFVAGVCALIFIALGATLTVIVLKVAERWQ